MNSTLASIPGIENALDQVKTTGDNQTSTTLSLSDRINEAYEVARVFATQIIDPEHRAKVERRLVSSGVKGSTVMGVKGPGDVVKMLSSVTNWQEVVANLKDAEIKVLEGELPSEYAAFTAYATVREIAEVFGPNGVDSIKTKIGYQKEDEYYSCTMVRMPTTVLTVQLRTGADGVEYLHQWFPGKELSSRLRRDDGDNIVRCGVQLQPVEQKSGQRFKGHASGTRANRAS